jgi:hypothetical protein
VTGDTVLAFHDCEKICKKEEEEVFWIMDSEASVHGWLAKLLLGQSCGKAVHHGRSCTEKTTHLMEAEKQNKKRGEGTQGPNAFIMDMPQWPHFLH